MFLSNSPKSKPLPSESIVQVANNLKVDISGAVKNPGVYELSSEQRIEDLILKSGGFLETANQEYISKHLNMAQKVVDGSKIYIPFKNESATSGIKTASQININLASEEELEKLPGIGAVTASKVVAARPFTKIEDLLTKKVISKSVFEKIKQQISVY